LPFKDKEKLRKYQKNWKRKNRAKKKEQKERAMNELLKLFSEDQLRIRIPNTYDLIFGRPQPKKKSKK